MDMATALRNVASGEIDSATSGRLTILKVQGDLVLHYPDETKEGFWYFLDNIQFKPCKTNLDRTIIKWHKQNIGEEE